MRSDAKWHLALIDDLLLVVADPATPEEKREEALRLVEEIIAVRRELMVASAEVRTVTAKLREQGALV